METGLKLVYLDCKLATSVLKVIYEVVYLQLFIACITFKTDVANLQSIQTSSRPVFMTC